MRRIKNELIAQLMLQLRFTPQKHRRKQLDAAEKLYGIIDRDKEYPFDFVCFRITGFHPKGLLQPTRRGLIKGEQILDDLQFFISKLSGMIAVDVGQEKQKVYTAEQLAGEFGVSIKTINRWRKRGLVARKFVFEDGVKRLGYLQATVSRFVRENSAMITRAGSFDRLTQKQRQQIIKEARKLSARAASSCYQIIEQICAKTKRSHETIRYILLEYEKSHPDKPIFKQSCTVLNPSQGAELYKLYKQGVSVKELTKRFDRCRSSIYRVVNQRRTRAILKKTIEYVASEEFLQPDARETILSDQSGSGRQNTKEITEHAAVANQETVQGSAGHYLRDPAGSAGLSQYLLTLKNISALNREQEFELFRRYNYLKFLACIARTDIKPTRVYSTLLTEIENYLAEAETIKNTIVEANLRMVVSIASKHTGGGVTLSDLISEGNLSLVQAVEKFDYTKGFRFSTYASWAIAKNFARKVPAQSSKTGKQRAASLANIQRDLRSAAAVDFGAVEHARQSLVQVITNELNEREQYVVLNHFGLEGSPVKKNTKTLMQIGQELSLSKERVRQIELAALQKLRHRLSKKEFELLTG